MQCVAAGRIDIIVIASPWVIAVRLAVAAAAALAFMVPLLAALHARVPGTVHRPLYRPSQSDRLLPFEIDGTARLVVQDVDAPTSHQRILLMVATLGTVPRLQGAELTFSGIACVYRTASDIELPDNYLVVFERDAECTSSG